MYRLTGLVTVSCLCCLIKVVILVKMQLSLAKYFNTCDWQELSHKVCRYPWKKKLMYFVRNCRLLQCKTILKSWFGTAKVFLMEWTGVVKRFSPFQMWLCTNHRHYMMMVKIIIMSIWDKWEGYPLMFREKTTLDYYERYYVLYVIDGWEVCFC